MSDFENAVKNLCDVIKKGPVDISDPEFFRIHKMIHRNISSDSKCADFLARSLLELRPEKLETFADKDRWETLQRVIHEILVYYSNRRLYNSFRTLFCISYKAWNETPPGKLFLAKLTALHDKYDKKSRIMVGRPKSSGAKAAFTKKLVTNLKTMNLESVASLNIVSLSDFFNLTFYHFIYGNYPASSTPFREIAFWQENIIDSKMRLNYWRCTQGRPEVGFYARITKLFEEADMPYAFPTNEKIVEVTEAGVMVSESVKVTDSGSDEENAEKKSDAASFSEMTVVSDEVTSPTNSPNKVATENFLLTDLKNNRVFNSQQAAHQKALAEAGALTEQNRRAEVGEDSNVSTHDTTPVVSPEKTNAKALADAVALKARGVNRDLFPEFVNAGNPEAPVSRTTA